MAKWANMARLALHASHSDAQKRCNRWDETGRLYDRQKLKLMCDTWLHKLKLKQVLASKQALKITD